MNEFSSFVHDLKSELQKEIAIKRSKTFSYQDWLYTNKEQSKHKNAFD